MLCSQSCPTTTKKSALEITLTSFTHMLRVHVLLQKQVYHRIVRDVWVPLKTSLDQMNSLLILDLQWLDGGFVILILDLFFVKHLFLYIGLSCLHSSLFKHFFKQVINSSFTYSFINIITRFASDMTRFLFFSP